MNFQPNVFCRVPPTRLERLLESMAPGKSKQPSRIVGAVAIGWLPLALLCIATRLLSGAPTAFSFFADFAVHARLLVAVPALILAEADCLPRLDRIVGHLIGTGIVRGAALLQFEGVLSSTRRLLGSAIYRRRAGGTRS